MKRIFTTLACIAALTIGVASAHADVHRRITRIVVPAGETASFTALLPGNGMVRQARLYTTITGTLNLSTPIDDNLTLPLYNATAASTGTLTLTAFDNKPIADTTLVTFTANAPPEQDTVLVLVLFTEN
jgi:hypothetical protein